MSSLKEIEEIDYRLPQLGKLRWFLLITFSFAIFLFMSFPIKKNIDDSIKSALYSIPGCSLDFKEINFEFLLPKVIVKDINIPMSCFRKVGHPIKLKHLTLNWRGLNFAPFGPHFKIQTNILGNDITAFHTLGLSSQVIKIQDVNLKMESLRQILPEIKLNGRLKTNSLIKINSTGLSDLKLTVQSKDLVLPSQEIMRLKLPNLEFNNLFIKANMTKPNEIQVQDIIVGDTESPIRANFKGSIKLNQKNFSTSKLDLIGEVAFSSLFLEKFAIIQLFMNKFNKKDDFYQLHFDGPITSPNVTSP